MQYKKDSLLIHPQQKPTGVYQSLTSQNAGWELLNFETRLLEKGNTWRHYTGENEYAFVILGGMFSIKSSSGNWDAIGQRSNVFDGMPYALYLPRQTEFEIECETETLDLAYAWCATNETHPTSLVTPDSIKVEIRGGGNATRQINHIIPPGFNCHRLVACEVYTPSGNWSSFPPHKHDMHIENNGVLLEADLEEVYFYKTDKAGGYAIQQVYNSDRSLNEIMVARNNDLILIPEGYHPVVAAHGYNIYYLNFLAGSAQSLQASDDPDFAWIKNTWTDKDKRVPLVK